MTRQQYLRSKGWYKKAHYNYSCPNYGELNTRFTWHHDNLYPKYARDIDEAWAMEMGRQYKDISWRPLPEIRTGRLKS